MKQFNPNLHHSLMWTVDPGMFVAWAVCGIPFHPRCGAIADTNFSGNIAADCTIYTNDYAIIDTTTDSNPICAVFGFGMGG